MQLPVIGVINDTAPARRQSAFEFVKDAEIRVWGIVFGTELERHESCAPLSQQGYHRNTHRQRTNVRPNRNQTITGGRGRKIGQVR
jgi:hypothetical protein